MKCLNKRPLCALNWSGMLCIMALYSKGRYTVLFFFSISTNGFLTKNRKKGFFCFVLFFSTVFEITGDLVYIPRLFIWASALLD